LTERGSDREESRCDNDDTGDDARLNRHRLCPPERSATP
jgi:hypothetical protein